MIKKSILITLMSVFTVSVFAGDPPYTFTDVKEIKSTSVKSQGASGTCWSFSGLSFFESEMIKNGKGEVDLSEMWIVRHSYYDKVVKYVRMHGNASVSAGGAFCDVTNVIDEYGIVPEEAYPGNLYGSDFHQHGELDAVIESFAKAIVSNPNRKLSTAWKNTLNGILDSYLGKVPEKFTYKGKEYTPKSFAKDMGLDMNQYVSLTSFNHHPFYSIFAIEVPDNWNWGLSYNLPLDEFMKVIDNSIENGYTVAWASDVSEKGFRYNDGFAVLPASKIEDMTDSEKAKWSALTKEELEKMAVSFDKIAPEIKVTQESRQAEFDNYLTTDDHGMHIVGTAKDTDGNVYYKVKNSWGEGNKYKGFFYTSKPFVAAKTTNIIVNKNALPKDIAKKLNIK